MASTLKEFGVILPREICDYKDRMGAVGENL